MSYLFYTNDSGTAILHPEVVNLVDSFRALNEKEMIYVILFTDYNSIYKQFPEQERRRKAMLHAFDDYNYDLVESPRILSAVQDYTSLQYSPKIETARIYQQKIDKFQEQLLTDDTPASSKKLGEAIDDLRKRITELEKEHNGEVQRLGVIKGNMTLSFIELMQSNMKHYKSITAKRK
jgi:hypothetical protein